MKLVSKICLAVILLATVSGVNAQKYSIEAGYNNPVRLGSDVSSTFFNGIKLGGTVEYDLKNNFSLLTGALYNIVYSDKTQGYPSSATVNYKTTGHFLDIPVRLTYNLPIWKNFKVFGFAGPNFNIGLSQTMKTTSTLTYETTSPLYIGNGTTDFYKESKLNRLNLQVGVGGGVQWKNYQLKSGYDFGINNLNKDNSANLYQKGWYVTAAYQF